MSSDAEIAKVLSTSQHELELFGTNHSQYTMLQKNLPVLVIEWPKEGTKLPVNSADLRVRWSGHVGKVSFIPIGGIRLYAAKGLHNALHYEITFGQMAEYIKIADALSKLKGNFIYEVINETTSDIMEDEHLKVRYGFIPTDFASFPLDDLSAIMMGDLKKDGRRNSTFKDYGFTGWKNSSKSADSLGLSKPRTHKLSDSKAIQKTLVQLSGILDEGFPNAKKEIYSDPDRNK